MPSAQNVLGEPLEPCSYEPLTGWLRDGCCNTGAGDRGLHLVCVQVTAEFLEFTQLAGNDLSTPVPEYEFPGLKPGDGHTLPEVHARDTSRIEGAGLSLSS